MEKSNELELELFSKAIIDSMGSFTLYFVQPDGGIGNKAIRLGFESIMFIGNNGFILYGNGKISGKKISRGKFIDDIRKIKIFYDANSKTYSWVNRYRVTDQKYIRVIRESDLLFPKGDSHELLENKINEEQLFAKINDYIDAVNISLPPDLQLKIKFGNYIPVDSSTRVNEVIKTIKNISLSENNSLGHSFANVQEIRELEFHNFAGLAKEDTGLGVDIFIDQCNSYREFSHPFWLYFRNSYGYSNEYVPITIETKKVLLGKTKLNIYHKDIIDVIKFINNHYSDLLNISEEKKDVSDLYKEIKMLSESVNKKAILLTEKSKLSNEKTGLPFDIWIGVNNKGHFVGVKFAPDNSTTKSNQFPEMSVPDCKIVSNRDFETWRAEYVKALIKANKDALIELGKNPQKYSQICDSLTKIGSDLKPIIKEPVWYPVGESLFGYTKVKNQEGKFNYIDSNNRLIDEDKWFDIANDFRQFKNGSIRAYTILNGIEGFLYLNPIRWVAI